MNRIPEILPILKAYGIQRREVTESTEISLSAPVTLVEVAANVSLTILEQTPTTPYSILILKLAEGANVTHARQLFPEAEHWQVAVVEVAANATYHLDNHAVGSSLHRQDLHIDCIGPGARAQIVASAVVPKETHLDQQITMRHLTEHSSSEQTFHNIVLDQGSATCNGRIYIGEGARGTDARLSNKNLALGDQATVNAKPELEIYNDDVSCAHGATVGRLDPTHQFYFESRGVSPEAARQLLSVAFVRAKTQGAQSQTSMGRYEDLLK